VFSAVVTDQGDEFRSRHRGSRVVLSAYGQRWHIENEYEWGAFVAKTPSKDYLVFAVRPSHLWRRIDFLLKADIDGERTTRRSVLRV